MERRKMQRAAMADAARCEGRRSVLQMASQHGASEGIA